MRLAVNSGQDQRETAAWAALPGLCCQAAGGEAALADPLAAAWILFYRAADIMDSVEDRDAPAEWWAQSGNASAISAATGLYFSACLALNQLEATLADAQAARDVREGVLRRFIEMCSGQHLDLTNPRPTLETYWRVGRAKSGAFFGMACWAGARLASADAQILQGFQVFGLHLGLLIQILDDLKEYQALEQNVLGDRLEAENPPDLGRSLPAAYVREVGPPEVVEQFERLLENPTAAADASAQIVRTIEQYGGAAYLLAELEINRLKALDGLELAEARQPARDRILDLLDAIYLPD